MVSRVRKFRDQTEVSCCLKYLIFGFNVVFWIIGTLILAVGVWAWSEKDMFTNIGRLTSIALDPAFVFIVVGAITFLLGFIVSGAITFLLGFIVSGAITFLLGFIVSGAITFLLGFTGCVGALRENTCLLAYYATFLGILLLLEMTAGILGFVFKDWIKGQATEGFQTFIVHYRDDPDQQNLIDWIQGDWLKCCGIEGPRDWDRNIYFNCSSVSVGSREACGVPFSCCQEKGDDIINKQCGYDVRKDDYQTGDPGQEIHDRGCLRAFEEWIEVHLVPVAAVAVAVAVLQEKDLSKIIHEEGCLKALEEWLQRNLLFVLAALVAVMIFQALSVLCANQLGCLSPCAVH
ncbi:unnamed protein product [Cyprideis torosa]|uniref:Uncharacterized protein n=1 Tax=Cyprideis torosa TaxID=163714 RepID=A0A7R8ZMN4_9CRUS|nr:unnamed protein product [Cyprideis torosa]CAG0884790.1 unnamed protein product [Cyprideis torosa]